MTRIIIARAVAIALIAGFVAACATPPPPAPAPAPVVRKG